MYVLNINFLILFSYMMQQKGAGVFYLQLKYVHSKFKSHYDRKKTLSASGYVK